LLSWTKESVAIKGLYFEIGAGVTWWRVEDEGKMRAVRDVMMLEIDQSQRQNVVSCFSGPLTQSPGNAGQCMLAVRKRNSDFKHSV